jgi:hypothetical protein
MDLKEVDKVDTVTADDRGRVTLGSEFADADVKVYVERVQNDA